MRHPARLGVSFAIGLAALVGNGWVVGQEPEKPTPNALKPQDRDLPFWQQMHQRFLDRGHQGDIGVLFLGDSITQGWESVPKIWDRYYAPRKAANFGIGGDQTGHVLWRIDHDELKGIDPKAVVLMIGTNNLGGDKDGDIIDGIKAVVGEIREALPRTKILLLGVFPRAEKPGEMRERIKTINQGIAGLDDGQALKYLDIGSAFLEADGTISKEVMPDFLHLSPAGYRRWADAIEPTLWSLVDEK